MMSEATVMGVSKDGTAAEIEETVKFINEGLNNGKLSPIVGQTFKLSEAAEAHVEIIEHKRGTRGTIVLLPWA